ncbi:cytochrome D1 domain-containing protein [Thermanaerothrix sp. 4228-RoL]|uniref:Cytochrome D1 domain-containing protein n=1 Tax=Thermanaerothrix solaris TaxID=3058434 RepID=A0ABU3NJT8_9CHLR|nr:cytochrome D1 domain-containing protein [Thermanaerothrix sp. 4228-RoL]MDT8897118.1 cytochrome D1 domain-containing protein [Thermanaerothrix sp. 4228-RoL]
MKRKGFLWMAMMLVAVGLAACGGKPSTPSLPTSSVEIASPTTEEAFANLALEGFKKGGCGACHVIPGVPGAEGTLGPDLSQIAEVAEKRLKSGEYQGRAHNVVDYLREAIVDPDAYVPSDCNGAPCQKGLMPANLSTLLTPAEIEAIVQYLYHRPEETVHATPIETTPVSISASLLSDEEFSWAKQVYFERCAGCHGTLRKGATGPALTPDVTQPKGTLALATIIFNGTPRGMPDWGKQGFFTPEQTEIMAKFLQMEPPSPPEMSLDQMKQTWKVMVPPDQRPSQPQTGRDWQNYFVVTLRDAGQVAVIDGDTYEVVTKIDTGYAVHISRMSATGRYVYVIGRDGRLSVIDLWSEIPQKVAEVQTCYDARSVEVSKYKGELGDFTDRYAIVGCYWPPHFVILDGQTLEPFKIVSTRGYTVDTEEFHPEPRVASIVASHFKPEWIVNVKEIGQIWLVNYSDPRNPTIKMIEAARYLHDGGWDATKRYFLVAANQSNKVAVVDALEGKLVALVDTPAVPHPGRGANWVDPQFGPVWSTGHLGDAAITSIGTDPLGHPDYAWKAVREITLPGAGSLFIKTHPTSPWIWVDMTLNSDPQLARTICVVAKADPSKPYKCWEVANYGRATHFEYNRQGSEVWVSVWGTADKPGQTGEIVIYDDRTLQEKARIPNLITPTGKFNVFNTVNDIY